MGADGELFVRVAHQIDWGDALPNEKEYPPGFWRELVERWLGIFMEPKRNVAPISNFYGMYGAVTAFGEENWYESAEAARLSIEWLSSLVKVVWWLKTEKYGPLGDFFRDSTKKEDPAINYFSARIPGTEGYEYLELSFAPHLDLKTGKTRFVQPRNDEELSAETWRAVTEAAWTRLEKITLAPVLADFGKKKDATILWGFNAQGAMNAAFLQFFFEELAHVNLPKCVGCGKPIDTPGRYRWCGDPCREKYYKRWQREKKRKGRGK